MKTAWYNVLYNKKKARCWLTKYSRLYVKVRYTDKEVPRAEVKRLLFFFEDWMTSYFRLIDCRLLFVCVTSCALSYFLLVPVYYPFCVWLGRSCLTKTHIIDNRLLVTPWNLCRDFFSFDFRIRLLHTAFRLEQGCKAVTIMFGFSSFSEWSKCNGFPPRQWGGLSTLRSWWEKKTAMICQVVGCTDIKEKRWREKKCLGPAFTWEFLRW